MKIYKLPIAIILLLLVLLFLHIQGMFEHWYVYFPLLDIINHFLGGLSIALIAYWLLKNPKFIVPISIIAGIAWELFEVYYDITGWPTSSLKYKLDTIKDLVMDTIGSLVVWFIIKYRRK